MPQKRATNKLWGREGYGKTEVVKPTLIVSFLLLIWRRWKGHLCCCSPSERSSTSLVSSKPVGSLQSPHPSTADHAFLIDSFLSIHWTLKWITWRVWVSVVPPLSCTSTFFTLLQLSLCCQNTHQPKSHSSSQSHLSLLSVLSRNTRRLRSNRLSRLI